MRVELHIGRMVVHGAAELDRDVFVEALQRELAARLPPSADALGAAQRFRSVAAGPGVTETSPAPGQGVADAAARGVAARLLG